MAPLHCPGDQILRARQRVHRAHIRMHVELDPLLLRGILALLLFRFDKIAHGDAQFPGIAVVQAFAPELHAHALFDPLHLVRHGFALLVRDRCRFLVLPGKASGAVAEKDLAQDGTGIVRHAEGDQHHLAALELLLFQLEDLALDHDQAAFRVQFLDLHRPVRDAPADDRLADRRRFRVDRQILLFLLLRGFPGFLFLLFRLPGLGGGDACPVALRHLFRGHGQRGVPPLFHHPAEPLFPRTFHRQLYPDLRREDLPDGRCQPWTHVALIHDLQADLVREYQRQQAVFLMLTDRCRTAAQLVLLDLPADVPDPGLGDRIVPPQEIIQHLPVGRRILQEGRFQLRRRHPHGQRSSGEHLPQHLLQLQELVFPCQHRTLKGDIGLLQRFDIGHPRR